MSRESRHLSEIEFHLEELLFGFRHEQGKCEVCGAYKAEDTGRRQAEADAAQMLAKVRQWQKEPWARIGGRDGS